MFAPVIMYLNQNPNYHQPIILNQNFMLKVHVIHVINKKIVEPWGSILSYEKLQEAMR